MKDGDAVLRGGYPFSLPWVDAEFELMLDQPVTILMGKTDLANRPF